MVEGNALAGVLCVHLALWAGNWFGYVYAPHPFFVIFLVPPAHGLRDALAYLLSPDLIIGANLLDSPAFLVLHVEFLV